MRGRCGWNTCEGSNMWKSEIVSGLSVFELRCSSNGLPLVIEIHDVFIWFSWADIFQWYHWILLTIFLIIILISCCHFSISSIFPLQIRCFDQPPHIICWVERRRSYRFRQDRAKLFCVFKIIFTMRCVCVLSIQSMTTHRIYVLFHFH